MQRLIISSPHYLLFQNFKISLSSSVSGFRGTSHPRPAPIMSSTTSRRPHRKTKTGCQSCKSRRIKVIYPPPFRPSPLTTNFSQCDEKKPVCLNCQKQSLCCEYIVLTQIRQVLSVATSPQQSNIGGGTTIPASELEYGADHGDHGGDLQLNLFHLELLHNYSISTALSVSNDPEICKRVCQLFSQFACWSNHDELLCLIIYTVDFFSNLRI